MEITYKVVEVTYDITDYGKDGPHYLDDSSGTLTISHTTGPDAAMTTIENVIYDGMFVGLMQSVCYAILALANGKDYEHTADAEYTSSPDKVLFKVDGNDVIISGNDIEGDRLPKQLLLEAMADCAEDFIMMQKQFYSTNPNMADTIIGLDNRLAELRGIVPKPMQQTQ